ncbi:WSC domain-containing protein, partial [Colletotrichum scovillei]
RKDLVPRQLRRPSRLSERSEKGSGRFRRWLARRLDWRQVIRQRQSTSLGGWLRELVPVTDLLHHHFPGWGLEWQQLKGWLEGILWSAIVARASGSTLRRRIAGRRYSSCATSRRRCC